LSTPVERPDHLLFLLGSPAHVRNFESVLAALAARGYHLTLLFEERKPGADEPGLAFVDRLSARHATVSWELQPRTRLGLRGGLRTVLEAVQDYLRYFEPPYGEPGALRSRALAFLPKRLEHALAAMLRSWPSGRRAVASAAHWFACRLGDDTRIHRELEVRNPSALVATPLVHFRSRQRGWVRSARRLGIGTMACVYSWDSLTNRGLMHAMPDRVAVWNEAQGRQAVELHGAPAGSIVVTGAWPYDHWFDWRASRSRKSFCQELGLAADRRIILYACSSRFIAGGEREAVSAWLRAVRSSADPSVATANVVIRPHPLNGDQWDEPALSDLPEVAVFPSHGADPVDDSSRAAYFDSIAHADAVVGVNTSALIESVILDRPALAFPAPRFRTTQEELPHFRLLVGEPGAVKVSDSMQEHLAQLGEVLACPEADAPRRRRFVETFIRPQGNIPVPTDRVVAAIEALVPQPDPE
jgi:hypothetical protein